MRATGHNWFVECERLPSGGWGCDVSVDTRLGRVQGRGEAIPASALPAGAGVAGFVGDAQGQSIGAGIGMAAGTAAGSFLGPAGAALGGALGGWLGGIIGDEAGGSGGGPVVRPGGLPAEASAANLERVARHVGITDGMSFASARQLLNNGLAQNWAGADHADARRLLAVIPESAGNIPSVAALVNAAMQGQSASAPMSSTGLATVPLLGFNLPVAPQTALQTSTGSIVAQLIPLILSNPQLLQLVIANPQLLQLLPLLIQYPQLGQLAASNPGLLSLVASNPQLLQILLLLATGQPAPGGLVAGLMGDDERAPRIIAGWGAIRQAESLAPADDPVVGLLQAGRRYLDATTADLVGAPGGTLALARAEAAAARDPWARAGRQLAREAAQL